MTVSNSFRYSHEKLAELEAMHDLQAFIAAKETELYVVHVADDDGSNREVYGFGGQCPLELTPGVDVCNAFKEKHYQCRSCVSETCARNYLAQHAFNSADHKPLQGDLQASFDAANTVKVFVDMETRGERDEIWAHVAVHNYYNAQSEEGQGIKLEPREPSRPPPSCRNRRCAIGVGPAARSRSRRRASSHRAPSPSAASPPRSRIVLAAAQEIERSAASEAATRATSSDLPSATTRAAPKKTKKEAAALPPTPAKSTWKQKPRIQADVELDVEAVAVDNNDITFTDAEIRWLLESREHHITPGGVKGKDDSDDCEDSEEWEEDLTWNGGGVLVGVGRLAGVKVSASDLLARHRAERKIKGKMNVKETSAEKRPPRRSHPRGPIAYLNQIADAMVKMNARQRIVHRNLIGNPSYMRKLSERMRTAQRAAQPVPRGDTRVTRKMASRS